MFEYRAYVIGKDDRILQRHDFLCATDHDATGETADGRPHRGALASQSEGGHLRTQQIMHMRWTPEEDRHLLELKQQGKHVALIAKELGRTETAVTDRLAHLRRQQQ